MLCSLISMGCHKKGYKSKLQEVLPLQNYKSATPGMMVLPLNKLPLKNLDAFQSTEENWEIAGKVISDYQKEKFIKIKAGRSILVNRPTEDLKSNIFTAFKHGDLELKIEFMIPRDSNAGIYFQSRYGIQILDSWEVSDSTHSYVGGIYQHWDEYKSEGGDGYEEVAPRLNAALAPGLWQELHILFRAPKFDEKGKKISNAEFEKVYLNGKLIHENVELKGLTRGGVSKKETAMAPLMLQGSNGEAAFRNIRYKTFDQTDSLTLGPLKYTIYEYDRGRGRLLLPEPETFDTLDILAEGLTDSLNVSQLSPKNERFAMRFSGDLHVPVSGNYLFQTLISTGGNLYIDGELITTDTGRSYVTLVGNTIHLEKGTHQLEISYFKRRYLNLLTLIYEGPGMERKAIASKAFNSGKGPTQINIKHPKSGKPELIRSFVEYGDDETFVHTLGQVGAIYSGFTDPSIPAKKTHSLTVGHPEGIHYTYDLYSPSLLKFWRGPFADISGLKQERGDLVLDPLGVAIKNKSEFPIAHLAGDEIQFIQGASDQLTEQGYTLTDEGRPIFKWKINGISVRDEILPSESSKNLIRKQQYESATKKDNLICIIAQNDNIDRLTSKLYRIKNFYIKLQETGGQQAVIYKRAGMQVLGIPILQESNQSKIKYQMIW